MWAAIQKARKILERRSAKHRKDRTRKFPCVLIILDELGQFYPHGRHLGPAEVPGQPPGEARPCRVQRPWPGWDDLYAIIQMGRYVNMHFIVCAQDFRDDMFGGKGARNFLGFIGMAGYNSSQWDKFMKTRPVPTMQDHIGRWIFSNGSQNNDTWVQVLSPTPRTTGRHMSTRRGPQLFLDTDGDTLVITDSDDERKKTRR